MVCFSHLLYNIPQLLYYYTFVNGHLSGSQSLAVTIFAAINIQLHGECVYMCVSVDYIPKGEISGS